MTPDEHRAEALLQALEAGRLPDQGFDHRAHLLVGWQLVRTRPFHQGLLEMQRALRAVTTAQGIEGKYDPGLTRSWMLRIASVADASGRFDAFLARNPTLLEKP